MQLAGFHHLTAVTADAPRNHDFYTRILGLRLVKKTVNQDDVSAYHLFYADGDATPGSDITFFDWPVGRERRGTHSIVRTGLRVGGTGTLTWWAKRFAELGVAHEPLDVRDGRGVLDFEDFEGQRLNLVIDETGGAGHPWGKSSVPAEHQILGLGSIMLSVPNLAPTDLVLTEVMGLRRVREYALPSAAGDGGENTPVAVQVYAMGAGGPAAELHVVVLLPQPVLSRAERNFVRDRDGRAGLCRRRTDGDARRAPGAAAVSGRASRRNRGWPQAAENGFRLSGLRSRVPRHSEKVVSEPGPVV